MQRFTISLDDRLAEQFNDLISRRGYENRSEAVRDLIRTSLKDDDILAAPASWCIANVSYVYDHHDQTATVRLLDAQHEHHDLVITSMHTHLDHDNCLETVTLRGTLDDVRAFAEQLVALRGVRHGNIHLIPLEADGAHHHSHGAAKHRHLKPKS